MKKLLILLLLTSCTNTKLIKVFPEPPKELLSSPEQLHLINNDSKLSDVTYVIIENYIIYHKETNKLQKLQEWIKEQRKLYK